MHTLIPCTPLQVFIFMTGVFVSSWVGGALLSVGEWIIKKLPLIKHIYSAAKQVTAGLNPENENAKSFRECVVIRHPRHGEYAIAFITGETVFQVRIIRAGSCVSRVRAVLLRECRQMSQTFRPDPCRQPRAT